jgi:hypothetical protein
VGALRIARLNRSDRTAQEGPGGVEEEGLDVPIIILNSEFEAEQRIRTWEIAGTAHLGVSSRHRDLMASSVRCSLPQ